MKFLLAWNLILPELKDNPNDKLYLEWTNIAKNAIFFKAQGKLHQALWNKIKKLKDYKLTTIIHQANKITVFNSYWFLGKKLLATVIQAEMKW